VQHFHFGGFFVAQRIDLTWFAPLAECCMHAIRHIGSSSEQAIAVAGVPEELNAEQEAFHKIFGSRERKILMDAEACTSVMRDAIAANPLLICGDMRGTSITSNIPMTKYVHSQGTMEKKAHTDRSSFYDYELFENTLSRKRGWDKQRCLKEWFQIKADEKNDRDMMGPAHSPECLAIPPNLLGKRVKDTSTENYEDRRLATCSREGVWSQEKWTKLSQIAERVSANFKTLTFCRPSWTWINPR
jgi:hypothetical protein